LTGVIPPPGSSGPGRKVDFVPFNLHFLLIFVRAPPGTFVPIPDYFRNRRAPRLVALILKTESKTEVVPC
jgi:hypothetical protein